MARRRRPRLRQRIRAARTFARRHRFLHTLLLIGLLAVGKLYVFALVLLAAAAGAGVVLSWVPSMLRDEPPGLAPLYTALYLIVLGGLTSTLARRPIVPIPSGIILREQDAPALFQDIHAIRKRLRAGRIDRVLLTPEFNAGFSLIPRAAGLAGGTRYLLVGLSLLQALPREHFRGVLAHEIGHYSGRLNRLERGIYAQLMKWNEVASERAESESGLAAALLRPFARWYVAKLSVRAHVARELIELEADRFAIQETSPKTMRDQLLLIALRGRMLDEEFWPKLWEQTVEKPAPPPDVYAQLRDYLKAPVAENAGAGWLRMELARQPDPTDSHPTLRARLEGTKTIPEGPPDLRAMLPGTPRSTAAEEYFGPREAELEGVLSALWYRSAQGIWSHENREARMRESLLRELRVKARREEPEDHLLWSMARLTEEFEGRREAFDLYYRYLQRNRDSPRANFAFGRILVEEGEDSGVPYIEFAMDANPFFVREGCGIIARWLYRQGRHDEATPWEQRAAAQEPVLRDAVEERSELFPDDKFEPHHLEEGLREALREQLARIETLREARLARKTVELFPEHPCYVLCVGMKRGFVLDQDEADRLRDWLDFPETLLVFAPHNRVTRRSARLIRRVSPEPVMTRNPSGFREGD